MAHGGYRKILTSGIPRGLVLIILIYSAVHLLLMLMVLTIVKAVNRLPPGRVAFRDAVLVAGPGRKVIDLAVTRTKGPALVCV